MSDTIDVDFALRRGDFHLNARFQAPLDGITVVFGPSGAGKSQLLLALAGLSRLDTGRIGVAGRTLDDIAHATHVPPHLRGIGLVFQDSRLFPHLSVRHNLLFAERRAPPSSKRVTLAEAASFFDVTVLLDRATRNLSGGERSRVALARALLSAPDLLLLDEPFAALDGKRRQAFVESIRQMHQQFHLPMIVVTHQIDDAAAMGDTLVAIRQGGIVAAGPLQETSTQPALQSLLDGRDIGAAIKASALSAANPPRAAHHWIRADHLIISIEKPRGLSARNVLTGQVSALTPDNDAFLVQIASEVGSLVSRVTATAVSELVLTPGQPVWAIVKAHSL